MEHLPFSFLGINHSAMNMLAMGVMLMKCAWDSYLGILPIWMRQDVDVLGRDKLRELRLRIGSPPELVFGNRSLWLRRKIETEDLNYMVNAASKYSAWAASSAAYGYLTAPGGHRIGLCGEVVIGNSQMSGIRTFTSVCYRVARQYPGIATDARKYIGSVLIIGPPGSGKTTLLREWIRELSEHGNGSVSVVDERGELFPRSNGAFCFDPGSRTDVLSGCTKSQGIDCVLRAMTPNYIAVDEITSQSDCESLIRAMWSGVDLLATAHATCMEDLYRREIYKRLVHAGMFRTVVVLDREQRWHAERMEQCTSSV